jgi:hypothetical protein
MASQDTLQGLGGGNQREHLDADGVLYPITFCMEHAHRGRCTIGGSSKSKA